jgi:hypothetical protein
VPPRAAGRGRERHGRRRGGGCGVLRRPHGGNGLLHMGRRGRGRQPLDGAAGAPPVHPGGDVGASRGDDPACARAAVLEDAVQAEPGRQHRRRAGVDLLGRLRHPHHVLGLDPPGDAVDEREVDRDRVAAGPAPSASASTGAARPGRRGPASPRPGPRQGRCRVGRDGGGSRGAEADDEDQRPAHEECTGAGGTAAGLSHVTTTAGDPAVSGQGGGAGAVSGRGVTVWRALLTQRRSRVALRDDAGDRLRPHRRGPAEKTRSAWAVMVSDGLTPRLALTAAPSTTCRPGWPCTCCDVSSTESSGEAPMGQPPRKCAVMGTSSTSATVPPGRARTPETSCTRTASCRTAVWARGIHDGFASPCPGVEVSRPDPSSPRRHDVVNEPSRVCITRATTVRRLHERTDRVRANATGWRTAWPRKRTGLGQRPPPSTSTVPSRPMRSDPGP